MDSIDYKTDEGFVLNGRRCDFTKDVLDSFPHRDGMDLCHGISFHCMAQGLVNAMNYYNFYIRQPDRERNEIRAFTLQFITGMIISVKRMKMTDDQMKNFVLNGIMSDSGNLLDGYRPYLRGIFYWMKLLDSIQNIGDWVLEGHMQHCTYYVNHILDLLYNEKGNLDYGYAVWNRSLQDAFDPSAVDYKDGTAILSSDQDGVAVTNLLTYTLGKSDEVDNTEDALFFYHAEIDDTYILYSSRNDTALFHPTTEVGPCAEPILYTNYLTGNSEEIPMV